MASLFNATTDQLTTLGFSDRCCLTVYFFVVRFYSRFLIADVRLNVSYHRIIDYNLRGVLAYGHRGQGSND